MQVAPKPVKFAVCQEETVDGMAFAVNRYLAQGFQPHGDLHIHKINEQTAYTQAMIKVELRPVELPADLQPSGNILVPRPQIVP
jgi:aminoglycoside phosphotransferase (APT) family kinase protein